MQLGIICCGRFIFFGTVNRVWFGSLAYCLAIVAVADMFSFFYMCFDHFLVLRFHIDSAPLSWVSTFINIQNCFIQWTNCSEQFCQALCSIGLVHFMETELKKLSTMPMSNVVSEY